MARVGSCTAKGIPEEFESLRGFRGFPGLQCGQRGSREATCFPLAACMTSCPGISEKYERSWRVTGMTAEFAAISWIPSGLACQDRKGDV